jgi:hypothetical protein
MTFWKRFMLVNLWPSFVELATDLIKSGLEKMADKVAGEDIDTTGMDIDELLAFIAKEGIDNIVDKLAAEDINTQDMTKEELISFIINEIPEALERWKENVKNKKQG